MKKLRQKKIFFLTPMFHIALPEPHISLIPAAAPVVPATAPAFAASLQLQGERPYPARAACVAVRLPSMLHLECELAVPSNGVAFFLQQRKEESAGPADLRV